ncbi:diaminopimelate decarboxylase [Emticicia sp. CRIBPO]|uniref:diaminopimelate decarboxylase n=1 Tax=Emticicia sp. CRIBPO TaxID=2683258 RepID=UPI001412AA67|nr:diaminopimelate decarboxylase [Emticicia sp. CRIBPO]NBA87685.1 diaminopimelate decarboxylase [Emticicia sp. CRIBPO]
MHLVNGKYYIQEFEVENLTKEFGTPLYVYDGHKIEEQIIKMRSAFEGVDLKLKYACKALTNLSILKLMRKNGIDIDVVSIEEALLALKVGYLPAQIQYTPSGVAFSEVQKAVELGLRINLDSIPLLEKFGETYGNSLPIAIRLNPSIMAGGNLKISTGHADSKFGISIEQIETVVELVKKYDLKVTGLHQHNGSDFKSASVIVDAMKKSFEVAFKYFPDLEFIDMGSGFKVAYSEDDHVTDMEDLGKDVVSTFNHFVKEYGKNVQLWFEPGKFLVSECGILLVNTNVVKYNPTRNFVHVDSGLNHLIRPMMYDAYHEIVNISNPAGEVKETYDVVGYICETDTLGKDRSLPKVEEGHVLGIKNAGAYAFSMSSNYNSRIKPAEVLIYHGKAQLIRKRETFEDILKNQIEVEF